MTAWRSKLIFLLIVYFAGFATAIYCLAPAPDEKSRNKKARKPADKGFAYSAVKSDEFAKSCNVVIYKGLHYGKDAAKYIGVYLKQKLDERPSG